MHARRTIFAAGSLGLALAVALVACGGSSRDNPSPSGGGAGKAAGSDTGASSSGGRNAVAGEAPVGGGASSGGANSGGANSAGTSSSAGEPGSAGNASGTAGAPSSGGPECETDEQCTVFNDCCECAVGSVNEEHVQCEKVCIQSACDARGITAQARCQSQRCVFDLSCNHSQVTCKSAKPECPAGQMPSVVDSCWGPCIELSQCRDVADCSDCPADTVCVSSSDVGGSFVQCVQVAPGCAANPTCECAEACPFSCNVSSEGIGCFCLVC